MTDAEPNAADRALAKEIADQQRRIRKFEFDAEREKARVQSTLDLLHTRREREADLRARLALARQQLYHLTHPAKGVCLPVGIDPEEIREQLDEHAHRALAGRAGAAEGTASARRGGCSL